MNPQGQTERVTVLDCNCGVFGTFRNPAPPGPKFHAFRCPLYGTELDGKDGKDAFWNGSQPIAVASLEQD